MIGAGKKKTRFIKLIPSVLRSSIQKSGFEKNRVKCSNPTHGLPAIPK